MNIVAAPRWPRTLVAVAIWTMMALVFSAPGREGPLGLASLDVIGLAKVLARVLLLLGFTAAIFSFSGHPKRSALLRVLGPYGVFVCWAVLSVTWSALTAVSVGQVAGLVLMWQFALVIGLVWNGPADTEWLLRHATLALFTVSGLLMAVDVVAHDLSGLNRAMFEEVEHAAASGLVHPTTAGATASLGLLLVLAGRVFWGWRWARLLLVPAVLVHGYVLLQAESRTAILITVALGGVLALRAVRGMAFAVAGLAASTIVVLYLALDPGLNTVAWAIDTVTTYMRRGESVEQLSTATGRTDLWRAIWASYLESPVIGHGYFVTSKNGLLDVWSGPANRTAHNVFLQVLVTTGAVGALLFLAGLAWAMGAGAFALRRYRDGAPLGSFLVLIAAWFAVWGMFSESFMGPVYDDSVTFYLCLGLAVAHVPAVALAPARPVLVTQVERAGAY